MQNSTNSSVAIVMAVYNGEQYLGAQLQSILDQTYSNWQLFVSDDYSTDGSLAIVKEFVQKDSRIHLVLQGKHYGNAQDHFMALLREVAGKFDYYMFCDQDDVWDSDKVEVEVRAAQDAGKSDGSAPVLVSTDLRVVAEDLSVLADSFAAYSNLSPTTSRFGNLLIENYVTGCTILLNDVLARMAAETPVGTYMVMHDWWFALIAKGLGELVYLPRPTISYRQHGDNTLGAARYGIRSILASWNWAEQCINMRDAIHQADEFLQQFGNRLSPANLAEIRSFAGFTVHPRILRVGKLASAHAWKTGAPRCIGEVLAILFSHYVNKDW